MDFKSRSVNRQINGKLFVSFLFCLTLFNSFCAAQDAAPKTPPRHPPQAFHFVQPEPINFDDHDGWIQIFDGKTLDGWDGRSDIWHVEDGALVGESSSEHPSGTTNIIWTGGEPGNFELKLEMKLEGSGANGGVQYRSFRVAPKDNPLPADLTPDQRARREQEKALALKNANWNVSGYQADFDFANQYTGQLYEQDSPRGIIAWRSQVVATEPGKKPTLLATLGSSDDLKSAIKPGEWNQVEIIADGNMLTHIINGRIMSVLVDTDPEFSRAKGIIAFEIEGPGKVKILHRNVWLKKLPENQQAQAK
jgi:3-keto-disaccharide hydrolase